MTTFINKSLARKREMLESGEKGFTLIELLIVVLIIGVLAAIAIPVYLTTQATARDNAVKSSVTEAKTAVMASFTATGDFPTSVETLQGFSVSPDIDVTLQPGSTELSFCIDAVWVSGTSGESYYTTQSVGATAGTCADLDD